MGAECPNEFQAVSGVTFKQGGCHNTVSWAQRHIDDNTDCDAWDSGLYVVLQCTVRDDMILGTRVDRISGTGSPLRGGDVGSMDMARIGGTCQGDEVMTGMHFERGGGCDQEHNWWEGVVVREGCDEPHREGVNLVVHCSKVSRPLRHYLPNNDYTYFGVGGQIGNPMCLDRVGSQCPEGHVAQGIDFKRGGCNRGDHNWRDAYYNFETCGEVVRDEGLMLGLNCFN
eukprot:c7968_g1_i1.p1 GENE.c7968_g1_i1~~c7968_g1_i1.p1  ORF type:complete len:227 (-),score=59.00 c7968_g1_i1:34-714(-)